MSGQSTRSLSETLTSLAFDDEVSAAGVPVARNNGRWGFPPDVALAQLIESLQTLCDAAYTGDVTIFGRTTVFSSGASPERGPLRPLTKSECDAYRLYVAGHDSLWEGKNQGDELEDTFNAHASVEGLDDIRVDFADLSRLTATRGKDGATAAGRFTNAEIDAWIRLTQHTGVKKARNSFMKDLRAKGLSATFERRWNDIKKNPVGRPPVL